MRGVLLVGEGVVGGTKLGINGGGAGMGVPLWTDPHDPGL